MDYPKYTREQNLCWKLTDNDISCIRHRFKRGDTRRQLSKIFNVSYTTIARWTDEAYRQRQLKQSRAYKRTFESQYQKEHNKKWTARKKTIQPVFKKWKSQAEMRCPYRQDPIWKKMQSKRVIACQKKKAMRNVLTRPKRPERREPWDTRS